MNHRRVEGLAYALISAAFLVLVIVGIHELNYASDHPYAYGPAKIIAWASFASAALALAVGLLAYSYASRRGE